jgi:hypothetical protein
MRWQALIIGLIAGTFAHSAAFAQEEGIGTAPQPGLTNQQAIETFGRAVMNCLQSSMSGQTITDLGENNFLSVRAAPAADRWLSGPRTSADTPVWITEELGGLLTITERSAARCEINAIQLPVERTFQTVMYAMQQARPDFQEVHVEPGYNPIAYQLESVVQGARYVIHFEGAEPGTPGHELRFSLLYAYVARQPVSLDGPDASGPN